MLRSLWRPLMNSQAVKPLIAMPIPATAITVTLATGFGSAKRQNASQAIAPQAKIRSIALPSAPITAPGAGGNLAPVGCTDFSTAITSPAAGQRVGEVFNLTGTASLPNFQYYKVEIRPDSSNIYNFYVQSTTPVTNGLLTRINTEPFGSGVHWIRLTVVDTTGNFPTPCTIPVIFP